MAIHIEELEIPWHQQRTPDVVKLVPFMFTATSNGKAFLDKYYKRVYAKAIITMLDDDCIIGSCKCSNCNSSIDIFSKFCSNCGAKISGRSEAIEGDNDA